MPIRRGAAVTTPRTRRRADLERVGSWARGSILPGADRAEQGPAARDGPGTTERGATAQTHRETMAHGIAASLRCTAAHSAPSRRDRRAPPARAWCQWDDGGLPRVGVSPAELRARTQWPW